MFIGADGHIRLADFGLAKEKIRYGELNHTFCGSVAYLPPEVVNKSGHNKTIDWYLLGELLYEMLYGTPPFYDGSKETLFDNILHKPLTFPAEPEVSDYLKAFIASLLDRNIEYRLGSKYGCKEIMEHAFFVGIDWSRVYNK